jgi:hypothetical protein
MSGHWRFRVAAFLLVAAGLATSPAQSNPLEDLLNPAPKEAAAPTPPPAPAKETCLLRPGSSAGPGQHWFYRVNDHRKCWYQAAERMASANAHRHAVRQAASAVEEDEPAPRKKTVADARAQMLGAAPADAAQPAPPAPEVADAAPDSQAATRVAAPVVIEPPIHQVTPERATSPSVDVEMLLADSSLAKSTDASSASAAAPATPSVADAGEGRWEAMATHAGMALITLGFIFLIGSLLVSRFREPRVASSASFLNR